MIGLSVLTREDAHPTQPPPRTHLAQERDHVPLPSPWRSAPAFAYSRFRSRRYPYETCVLEYALGTLLWESTSPFRMGQAHNSQAARDPYLAVTSGVGGRESSRKAVGRGAIRGTTGEGSGVRGGFRRGAGRGCARLGARGEQVGLRGSVQARRELDQDTNYSPRGTLLEFLSFAPLFLGNGG